MAGMRQWYESVKSKAPAAKQKAIATAHAVKGGLESVAVGAALGAIDCYLGASEAGKPAPIQGPQSKKAGLDIAFGGGTDASGKVGNLHYIPIDAVVAVAGIGASIAASGHEYADDMCTVGKSALAIFGFRKMRDYSSVQLRNKGQVPGYEQSTAYLKSGGLPGPIPAAAATTHGESYRQAAAFAGGPRFGYEVPAEQDPIVLAAQSL